MVKSRQYRRFEQYRRIEIDHGGGADVSKQTSQPHACIIDSIISAPITVCGIRSTTYIHLKVHDVDNILKYIVLLYLLKK